MINHCIFHKINFVILVIKICVLMQYFVIYIMYINCVTNTCSLHWMLIILETAEDIGIVAMECK